MFRITKIKPNHVAVQNLLPKPNSSGGFNAFCTLHGTLFNAFCTLHRTLLKQTLNSSQKCLVTFYTDNVFFLYPV